MHKTNKKDVCVVFLYQIYLSYNGEGEVLGVFCPFMKRRNGGCNLGTGCILTEKLLNYFNFRCKIVNNIYKDV